MHEHTALLILVMSLVTVALRFAPFAVFSGGRKVPPVVLYLGRVLPGAVLGMLVIYCLKDLSFAPVSAGIAELAACGAVIALQIFGKNSILSIFGGTAFYMVLIHLI